MKKFDVSNEQILEKSKYNLFAYLMVIVASVLCMPSLAYLFTNKTVFGYGGYFQYTLTGYTTETKGLIEGIIFISLLLLFSAIYLLIVKNEEKIFKNKKEIAMFIIIVALIFTIMLPIFSSDIFFYMGDSWIAARYKANPYYTSVKELQNQNINDEILEQTGYWSDITSVYGPIWNNISTVLSGLSFGSVTLCLFMFKIASFAAHLLNCYFIYKITGKTKHVLLYGLNPLVLVDLLSNVHNDIYLILFVLIAIYFMIKNKNIYGFIGFLALSVATKYSTILLVPFLLIYYFKDKPTIIKRITSCFLFGLAIILIVAILYLPYYRDLNIFTNMLEQNKKYSQSLILLLKLEAPGKICKYLDTYKLYAFIIIYAVLLTKELFKKKITLENICNNINTTFLLFIFIVLTTFQKWYILWMFPTIFYSGKKLNSLFYALTITCFIPSLLYFYIGGEEVKTGAAYSLMMLVFALMFCIVYTVYTKTEKLDRNYQSKHNN